MQEKPYNHPESLDALRAAFVAVEEEAKQLKAKASRVRFECNALIIRFHCSYFELPRADQEALLKLVDRLERFSRIAGDAERKLDQAFGITKWEAEE